MTVTITAAAYRAFGAVRETLPVGIDYVSSNLPQGQVPATGQKARFIRQDDGSFGYTATASGTPGKNSFRGIPTDSAGTHYPVAGASRVTVQRASGPGPTNNPPTFFGDQATRSVPESTGAGMNIGARVQRTDRDGDTPTYPQGGTDAASFAIVGPTGQLQTKDALDQGTKSNHTVTVTATGPDGAADPIRVTVPVTKVDEKGMVTLLEMHPGFVAAATSIPADPESGVTGTARQGAGSGTPDGAGTDINGATSESGTSVENDGAVPPGHRDAHRRRGLRQDGRPDGGQRGNLHPSRPGHRVLGGRPDGGPVT